MTLLSSYLNSQCPDEKFYLRILAFTARWIVGEQLNLIFGCTERLLCKEVKVFVKLLASSHEHKTTASYITNKK